MTYHTLNEIKICIFGEVHVVNVRDEITDNNITCNLNQYLANLFTVEQHNPFLKPVCTTHDKYVDLFLETPYRRRHPSARVSQIDDPFNQYLPPDERSIDLLNIGDEKDASRKRVANMPPKETEIDKLPKYCHYILPSETHGDYFEYEKQTDDGKHVYRSNTSRDTSTTAKFVELVCYLEENKLLEW